MTKSKAEILRQAVLDLEKLIKDNESEFSIINEDNEQETIATVETNGMLRCFDVMAIPQATAIKFAEWILETFSVK